MICARTPRHLFDKTLTVQRRSAQTADGRTPSQSWSDVDTFRANVQPMKSAKAVDLYGAERATRMYTVFCDPTESVRDSDRLKHTDPRDATVRYLKITSDPANAIEAGVVLEIDCEAVEGRDG